MGYTKSDYEKEEILKELEKIGRSLISISSDYWRKPADPANQKYVGEDVKSALRKLEATSRWIWK